jgi:hypothetical protein
MERKLTSFGKSVFVLSAFAILSVTGCGGPFDSSVRGKVTLDGNPLPRGVVTYQPVSGGPSAYAMIEENAGGSYVIRTGRGEGLPSGEYYVTVTANEPSASSHSSKGGPPPPGKLITPAWYRARETSGLKFTVQRGKNEINLELTSQPPAGWKSAGKS